MTSFLKPSTLKPALVLGADGILRVDAGVSVNSFSYSLTPVTLPTLVPGEDYKVYAGSDGTPFAWHYDLTPSDSGAVLFAGFHYSPGGLATNIGTGGNSTPTINPYSFWDLKYRPNCRDPRGMVKIGNGSIWIDIYLCNQNHQTLGTSRNNQTIATAQNPPIRAYDYGGAGTSKYTNNIMWNYDEVFSQHGKRPGTYREHCLGAFGVVENMGRGNHPITTGLGTSNVGSRHPDYYFTSKWGIIQAAGVLWIVTETPAPWKGTMGPGATADPVNGWDTYNVTGGIPGSAYPLEAMRGQVIMQTNYDGAYVMHGGKFSYEDICGSRAFENIEKLWDASPNYAARGVANHIFQE